MRGSPWSELTGDEVVSPIGFALLVPYSAVSMFLANPDLRGTSGALRLLVAVLAQLVLYAVLASWLIATRRWPALSAGPLRVISAFVLASAIRAILVAQAIETMGLSNSIDWARRLPGSVLGFTVALSVIDIVLRSLRQHRTRVEQLEARQQAARLACDTALVNMADQREAIVSRIRAEFTRRIEAIADSEPSLAAQQLKETGDDLLRPLSRQLATKPAWQPPAEPGPVTATFDVREFLSDAASQPPLQPGWITILFLCLGAPFILTQLHTGYALALLAAGSVIVWCLMTGCNLVMGMAQHLPPWPRATVLLLLLLTAGVALSTSSALVIESPSDVLHRILLGDFLLVLAIAIALVLARAARAQERTIEARIEAATFELDWASTRIRCVQWRQQRALARALHGPVQSAVSAAAMRLEKAVSRGRADRELLESTRGQLLAMLDKVREDGTSTSDLDTVLREYADTWAGVCEITWRVSPATQVAMQDDPIARFAATELAGECCWNAIRHANAGVVEVSVEFDSMRTLRLTVVDDGIPPESPARGGLGTDMLNDMCLVWTRHRDSDHTVVSALVPVCGVPGSASAMASPSLAGGRRFEQAHTWSEVPGGWDP